jgi:hypothetical protein
MGKRCWLDFTVYLSIVGFGVLAFALSSRSADFMWDVYYLELAKSIIAKTGYGFNFKPETMLPPGFPYLLAMLIVTLGSSYAVLVRSMVVFTTLGLITSYELLRCQQDRVAAAVACLLLASSPALFLFSTTLVFSDMPYFFLSMLLLWLFVRLDVTDRRSPWERALWWLLCGCLLLASIMIRSTGMALLSGIVGWQAVSFVREPERAKRRFKILLLLVIAGGAGQLAWMFWAARHQTFEWPIHGYREHYVAQLTLKNGNDPELGRATWKDVLKRPAENADGLAAAMVGLFLHKLTAPAWYSPMTVIPLALLLLGLGYSFWKTGGGLLEWYFVSYEAMYLFWPWNFELRFLLPIAPIAFLYAWRGGIVLWRLTRDWPREVGATFFALAVIGGLSSIVWGWNVPKPQARFCIAIWGLIAAISAAVYWGERKIIQNLSLELGKSFSVAGRLVPLGRALGGAAVICLMAFGGALQVTAGMRNLHRDPKEDPDIEAALWIKGHSEASTVVMARKEDLVFHYAQRRVIWFPPSTDPKMLMDGIRRFQIRQIVVVDRSDSYWKPSDRECFQALSRAYPHAFHLVHQGPQSNVFEVVSRASEESFLSPLKIRS